MKPGRYLDAMVAEKVMGWRHDPGTYEGSRYLLDPAGARSAIPNYSTDIAAAWEVVEKLKGATAHFQLQSIPGGWSTRIFRVPAGLSNEEIADTAPMAICLAALKAVGVEV